MKAHISLLILACVLCISSKAQLSFGPVAGFNVSGYAIKSENGITSAPRMGLRAGGLIDIPRSNNFHLQAGAYYVMNGFKTDLPYIAHEGYDYILNMNTIEVPVSAVVKFGDPGRNRFFFGISPYVAYHVSGKVKSVMGDYIGNFQHYQTYNMRNAQINRFDFGAGMTAGYEMKNGTFARLYYQRGFQGLYKSTNVLSTFHPANYSFGVSVGYLMSKKQSKK